MQAVIFGAGKIAEVLHNYICDDASVSIAGFTCDRAFMTGHMFRDLPLVAFEEIESRFPPATFAMLVAVGYQDLNDVRAERCRQARDKGYQLMSWVSPNAHVARDCVIGTNSVVMDGAIVQPGAHLGDNVFVWGGAVVGHHAIIGDHCWLASNCTISSIVAVEPSCFIGVNAAIGHGITVGGRSIIGAGAVITHSTAPGGVYVPGDTERLRLSSERFLKIARLV
jgi:sugar O-acyltransferase (sialic acid O-acetyltransferase NeuD family)